MATLLSKGQENWSASTCAFTNDTLSNPQHYCGDNMRLDNIAGSVVMAFGYGNEIADGFVAGDSITERVWHGAAAQNW